MDKRSQQLIYEFGEFRLDVPQLMLYRDGSEITLVPKAVETLLILLERHGRIVSKDELLKEVWPDTIVEDSSLFTYFSMLRKKLGNQRNGTPYLETFRRRGYRFNGEVRVLQPNISREHDRTLRGEPSANTAQTNALSKAIAILPFRPIAGGTREQVLELGLADTLITRLSNKSSIVVRPTSSVRRFYHPDQDAIEAGKVLRVESVLEGSLQRSGERIRVNVRLIRVEDGIAIWSGTFDEDFTDIFRLQDTITDRIVSALDLRLIRNERPHDQKRYTENPESYSHYLCGRYHRYKMTEAGTRQAVEFYKQAIRADPDYALAYAGLADACLGLAIPGFSRSKEVCPRAQKLARRALQLDEGLAAAEIVLGVLSYFWDWDWSAAEAHLRRALDIDPNNSEAHRAYSNFLSFTGRHDQAIEECRLARDLDPTSLFILTIESQALFFAGREDEAIRQAQRTLDFDQDFWHAHNQLGRVYTFQGRYDEAIAELIVANELASGSSEPAGQLGYAFALMGERKRAIEILNTMERRSKVGFVPFYDFAIVLLGLGLDDKALDMLEKSAENREVRLSFVLVDFRWDKLRSHPRLIEILRSMNRLQAAGY